MLLIGCAQTQSVKDPSGGQITTSYADPCIPVVSQGGKQIEAKRENTYAVYELERKPFTVSVSSVECRPSMAETGYGNAVILGTLSAVFSPVGYEMAGYPGDGALPLNRNVVLSLMQKDLEIHAAAAQEHKSFCAATQKCLPLIKAYRSYWPFSEKKSGEVRRYAEINALSSGQKLESAGSRGHLFVVVYTHDNDVKKKLNHLMALRAHPLKINFIASR